MTTRASIGHNPDDPRHGTGNGYKNLRCRCDRCREAWRVECMGRRRRRGVLPREEYLAAFDEIHGTSRWRRGCRCEVCRAAIAAEKRLYRDRHPEKYALENKKRTERRRQQRAEAKAMTL